MNGWSGGGREGGRGRWRGAAPPPDAPLGRRAAPGPRPPWPEAGPPSVPEDRGVPQGCVLNPQQRSVVGEARRWFPVVFASVGLVVLVFPPVELMIRTTCFIN